MKAKTLSILSKVLAFLFIVISYALAAYFGKRLPNADEAFAMVQVALVIGGLFAPIDVSLIVQNIKGIKDATKP
jgi:hypothetical protein